MDLERCKYISLAARSAFSWPRMLREGVRVGDGCLSASLGFLIQITEILQPQKPEIPPWEALGRVFA